MKALFAKMGIFNETESDARHEIQLEEYIKKVQIEARMMGYIASNFILPSAIQYQNRLIQNIKGMKDIGLKPESYRSQKDIVTQMSIHINAVSDNVEKMIEERKKVNAIADTHKRAYAYCDKIKPFFDVIRYNADKLELMVDDSMWQLPKYRELLYMR